VLGLSARTARSATEAPQAVDSRFVTTRSDLVPVRPRASARRRVLRTAATGALALAIIGAGSATAFAAGPAVDQPYGKSDSLGTVNSILIFAVIPLAVLGLMSLIFLRPGSSPGAQRYRPGRGWNANPTWVGVPAREDHDVPALEGADKLQQEAGLETDAPVEEPSVARQDPTVGGARGSW
jgi:hypothetical protein